MVKICVTDRLADSLCVICSASVYYKFIVVFVIIIVQYFVCY